MGQYSSKQYRGLQAGEYPCGPIVANYLGACTESFNFTILWLILHPWNEKLRNNMQLEKIIFGNKELNNKTW